MVMHHTLMMAKSSEIQGTNDHILSIGLLVTKPVYIIATDSACTGSYSLHNVVFPDSRLDCKRTKQIEKCIMLDRCNLKGHRPERSLIKFYQLSVLLSGIYLVTDTVTVKYRKAMKR